jgi:hypothetical protein
VQFLRSTFDYLNTGVITTPACTVRATGRDSHSLSDTLHLFISIRGRQGPNRMHCLRCASRQELRVGNDLLHSLPRRFRDPHGRRHPRLHKRSSLPSLHSHPLPIDTLSQRYHPRAKGDSTHSSLGQRDDSSTVGAEEMCVMPGQLALSLMGTRTWTHR